MLLSGTMMNHYKWLDRLEPKFVITILAVLLCSLSVNRKRKLDPTMCSFVCHFTLLNAAIWISDTVRFMYSPPFFPIYIKRMYNGIVWEIYSIACVARKFTLFNIKFINQIIRFLLHADHIYKSKTIRYL